MTTNVFIESSGPNMVIRALWFVFVGWWLGQLAIWAAWLLNLLVITLPIGLYILNRLPQIFTLRAAARDWQVSASGDGVTVVKAVDIPQRNFILRAAYFVLVVWWFSFIWLQVAWLMGFTIVLLPLSFLMFSKSAALTTLRRT